jgi:hypothetical protein
MIVGRVAKLKEKILMKRTTFVLMLATFFNPLGFDALFKAVMDWTGSYWTTDIIFYLTSLALFILYFYLVKKEKKDEKE